jgi:hypothetical protein
MWISKGISLYVCRLPVYLKQSGKAIYHEVFLFIDGCDMIDAVE